MDADLPVPTQTRIFCSLCVRVEVLGQPANGLPLPNTLLPLCQRLGRLHYQQTQSEDGRTIDRRRGLKQRQSGCQTEHRNDTHPCRVPYTLRTPSPSEPLESRPWTLLSLRSSHPSPEPALGPSCLVAEEDAAVQLQMVIGLWWLAYD